MSCDCVFPLDLAMSSHLSLSSCAGRIMLNLDTGGARVLRGFGLVHSPGGPCVTRDFISALPLVLWLLQRTGERCSSAALAVATQVGGGDMLHEPLSQGSCTMQRVLRCTWALTSW